MRTESYRRLQQLLRSLGEKANTSRLQLCSLAGVATVSAAVPEPPAPTNLVQTTEAPLEVASAVNPETVSPSSDIIIEPIPEPPPIPEQLAEITEKLNALGEPTFESLGLAGWSPIGLVHRFFEFAHVDLGLPWWQTIVLGTLSLC